MGSGPGPSPRALAGIARRGILMAVACALLAGCGATVRTGIDVVRTAVSGQDDLEAKAREIARGPYASLMMDDGTVSAVLVLGNDDGGRTSWHGGSRMLFLCEGALVCGTHELGARLDDMRIEGDNPLLDLRNAGDGATVRRRYDWPEGYRYGIPVTGTVQRGNSERVEILGRARDLVRYDEILRGPGVEGRNSYWVDPATGTLWKSRQLVAPGTYVDIVQLKPYRRSAR